MSADLAGFMLGEQLEVHPHRIAHCAATAAVLAGDTRRTWDGAATSPRFRPLPGSWIWPT